MAKPTRFEVNGERHYATDKADKAYPSVTTILGATSSERSKKALLNWQGYYDPCFKRIRCNPPPQSLWPPLASHTREPQG